ncbi:MAG: hypothetical protein U9R08_03600 [Nanoarchaeota archaeon]|nr:hypothetical protein [Nanoarchaeota archaeon]
MKDEGIGGIAFITSLFVIALAVFIWVGIWGHENNSIRAGFYLLIFGTMLLSAPILIILGETIFKQNVIRYMGGWSDACLSFVIGLVAWGGMVFFTGGYEKSVFAISQNQLATSVSGQMPKMLEFGSTSFLIPIAEEFFWMFTIPIVVKLLLDLLGKKFKIFTNIWLQIAIIATIAGTTFAIFHIGKLAFTAFIIAAIIFRALMIVIVKGDQWANMIKYVAITTTFSFGAHVGNNLAVYGVGEAYRVITQNFFQIGWIITLILLVIFGGALNKIGIILSGDV